MALLGCLLLFQSPENPAVQVTQPMPELLASAEGPQSPRTSQPSRQQEVVLATQEGGQEADNTTHIFCLAFGNGHAPPSAETDQLALSYGQQVTEEPQELKEETRP